MTNITARYRAEKMTLTYFLVAIVLLVVLDVTMDFLTGMPLAESTFDIMLEGTIITVVLFMARYIWTKLLNEREEKSQLQNNLEDAHKLAQVWEQKSNHLVKEFQTFIFMKFSEWNLSKSEKEIGLMILQGKSSKEIAAHRFTSERTIRNQCRSIYEKSQFHGKNEFSAFFLTEFIGDLRFS